MSNTFATNASANSAVSYLHRNSSMQSSSIAKLSSGSRIVKASDDAASLAVGTKLKADVTALKQASTNASQAASLMQVADGALSRVGDTLMRMKSLATQARSDVLSNTERSYLDQEYQEMVAQVDFITSSTKFNGNAVVDGTLGASVAYESGLGLTTSAAGSFAADATSAGMFATADTVISITDEAAFTAAFGDATTDRALTLSFTEAAAAGNVAVTITDAVDSSITETVTDAGASATNYTGTLDFATLGISIDFSGVAGGVDTTDANNATNVGLLNYTGGTETTSGITLETIGAVDDDATFTVGYSAASGTTTFTVTEDATGETRSFGYTNGTLNDSVEIEDFGVRLNIEELTTADGDALAANNVATVEHGAAAFQLGVNAGSDDVTVDINSAAAKDLKIDGTDITSIGNAETASNKLDAAIEQINNQRASLGANMSRIEKINENLSTTLENLDSARSVLMDVDVAAEMTKFSTNQVMTQAATAMLAQANQLPQNLMKLLQ
jgi:flagellin